MSVCFWNFLLLLLSVINQRMISYCILIDSMADDILFVCMIEYSLGSYKCPEIKAFNISVIKLFTVPKLKLLFLSKRM